MIPSKEDEITRIKEEIERLGNRVRYLENERTPEQPQEQQESEMVPIRDRPPTPPMAGHQQQHAPSLMRRALHFMYNVGNTHAIIRNFEWAVQDGAYVVGAVGGVAAAAAKVAPEMAAKTALTAKNALLAAKAAAAANPALAGVAACIVGTLVAERITRYEDKEGKTRHRCTIS